MDSGGWIQTRFGKQFFHRNPSPESIDIADIAHALACQCRFSGHVREPYSVAQHSVLASQLVPAEDALWALLHDAAEAYVVDLPRPMKQLPEMAFYRELEKRAMEAICVRFDLPMEMPASVKRADEILLITEQRDLMGPQIEPWAVTAEPLPYRLIPWPWYTAELQFLKRFRELDAARPAPAPAKIVPLAGVGRPVMQDDLDLINGEMARRLAGVGGNQ
jgi:uncharacterized protein